MAGGGARPTRSGRARGLFLVLRRQAAVDDAANFFHQALARAEILGLDGRVKDDADGSALDGEARLGHDVVRADNCNGNNWKVAFTRQIERAFFEWEQLAIEGAPAFDEDRHIDSLLQNGRRFAYGGNAGITVAAIDRHKGAQAHGFPEQGVAE